MPTWIEKGDLEKLKAIPPEKIVVFDTETTGLDSSVDEILQISMIDGNGEVLLDTLVKPKKAKTWPDAQAIHGITPEMVAKAPSFRKVKRQVEKIIRSADLLVGYNLGFDLGFIQAQGVKTNQGTLTFDVMKEYAPVHGIWSYQKNDWKWAKLEQCARHYGYSFNAHNALEDAKATLHCFNAMLADNSPYGYVTLHNNKDLLKDTNRNNKQSNKSLTNASTSTLADASAGALFSAWLSKGKVKKGLAAVGAVLLLSVIVAGFQSGGNGATKNSDATSAVISQQVDEASQDNVEEKEPEKKQVTSTGREEAATSVSKKETDKTDKSDEETSSSTKQQASKKPKDGWIEENGEYVFYSNGEKANGWVKNGDKYYYCDKGVARTSWQKIDGSYYCFGNDGELLHDRWAATNGQYYYLGSDGAIATNQWASAGGKYYYLGSNGKAVTNQWVQRVGKWYYLGTAGAVLTSQWIDGTYYVGSDGAMLTNTTTPDGYKVDSEGKYVPPATTSTSSSSSSGSGSKSSTAATHTYILNTNTHKFHDPGCRSVKQMSDKNKKEYTGTRDEVIAMGYDPCKNCNP